MTEPTLDIIIIFLISNPHPHPQRDAHDQEVLDAADAKKGDLKKFVSKFVENLHNEQQRELHTNGNGIQSNGTTSNGSQSNGAGSNGHTSNGVSSPTSNGTSTSNGNSNCKGSINNGSLLSNGAVAS